VLLNSAVRLTGLGLQFGLLAAVYTFMPSVVDLYIKSLFLSTIGLSVARAGANFATLRQPNPTEGWQTGDFSNTVARIMIGIAAIALATCSQPADRIPYAAFSGVFFGVAHNAIYRRFLAGTGGGGAVFALFGFAHFAGVLGLLLVLDGASIFLSTNTTLGIVVVGILVFVGTLRSNLVLALGELTYSYAYPLCIYVASSAFSGSALWLYFVVAKSVDALSILFSFNFQPRFFIASPDTRRQLHQRAKHFFDRAFVVIFVALALSAGAGWHLGLANEHVANAAIQAFVIAFGFFLCSIAAFIFVCAARNDLNVLAYGLAVSLIPVVLLRAIGASASGMTGCLAALFAIWLINNTIAWRTEAAQPVAVR
jgi:hypothetical protein